MKDETLLPCPFCGGKAEFDYDDDGLNWISCSKCGISTDTAYHTDVDARETLRDVWNRRAIQSGNSAQPVTVPAGYVLVPVEPTPEMMLHKSGCQHHAWNDPDCPMRETRRLVWSHMLSAAPTAPDGYIPDEAINAAYEKHLYGIMSGTGNKRAAVDFLNECLASVRIKP